jgi:hypothetical protein
MSPPSSSATSATPSVDPPTEPLPWFAEDAEPNADLWASADETRHQIVGLYHRAWAHADSTIETLPLDATGHVPWWPADRNQVTLHRVLVHVMAETHRHAGHADIIRELLDGQVGLREENPNMAPVDPTWWKQHRARLEEVARQAART